jgi:hypothetical protein
MDTKYIFVTLEGFTQGPNEEEVENMQVLGFGVGKDADDAFEDMLKGNLHLLNTSFNQVMAYQLSQNHTESDAAVAMYSIKDDGYEKSNIT